MARCSSKQTTVNQSQSQSAKFTVTPRGKTIFFDIDIVSITGVTNA